MQPPMPPDHEISRILAAASASADAVHGEFEADLRNAIQHGLFLIKWQPMVNCSTGELYGFEALLRWDRPGHGPVSPALFVPVAESLGLHRDLDAWVLRTACAAAVHWPRPTRVAVNISAKWFQSNDLSRLVEACLRETGLEPARLELEVTERVFIEAAGHALPELGQLKALGVSLSLDDFGTGFSSIGYLRNIAFDKLKLDRMFIEGLGSCRRTETIVRSMLQLGAGLGMVVCAEGVEQESQLGILQAYQCNEVQGYLIGRPDTLNSQSFRMFGQADQSTMFIPNDQTWRQKIWATP